MREMIQAFEQLGHEVRPVIAGGVAPAENELPILPNRSLLSFVKKFIPSIVWQSLKDYRLLRFDQRMERKLEREIEEFKPDFVYERLNYLQLSGVKAAQTKGIPHLFEINSPYVKEKLELEGNTFFRRKAVKHEKLQLTLTHKSFAVTSALAKYLIETHELGDQGLKIDVLPNAINLDKFFSTTEKVSKIKAQIGIQDHEKVIGFVGSILKWHGVDRMLQAFAQLAKSFEEVRLLVVGDGESLPDLKQQAKTLALGNRVIFTGNVAYEEVPNYIGAMDITLLPNTNWYCSPIKIFEYGSLEKAIIAPDYSCIRDVMTPNEDGILIDASPESLELAIKKLLENDELRKSIARSFYDKVIKQYTWKKNAEQVLSRFISLTAKNKQIS